MPERYGLTIQSLGSHLQWLISQDQILAKPKGEHQIVDTLKRVKEFLEEIEFDEKWVFEEVNDWIRRLSRYKLDQKIKKKTAGLLSFDANSWYQEVSDYLSNCYYWEVRPNGISDLKKLFEDETVCFFKTKSYWRRLSKVAKHDLDEACCCLAFERPTAAAFLVMRATEDVLRKLYSLEMKRPLLGFIEWGEITKQLRSNVDKQLIENLDYLRNNFRNPVAHPDKIYEQKESERLFHTAISVIEQMIDEM